MEPSPVTLSSFPLREGMTHRASWAAWILKVHDYLANATPTTHGLLGCAMSPEEYAVLTEGHAFVLLEEPVLPDNPTQAQLNTHQWRYKCFKEQHMAIKTAKAGIILALSGESLGLITEDDHGTRRRTIRDILDILRENYGLLTSADMETEKAIRGKPLTKDTTVRAYVAVHRESHARGAAANQATPEADKVRELSLGVKHRMPDAVKHFRTT